MLTYINIKNFAIIEDVELDLQTEMTSLTGETGAGKSIIIDSLELALGRRADATLIRNGAERCEITAVFDVSNIPKAKAWLIEQELDSENDCIIRRIISNDGRSKSSVNGNVCTQQTLRIIGDFLLSIHGQHENQTLLRIEHQRELLDAFANNKDILNKVKNSYNNWFDTKQSLIELECLAEDSANKIEFLDYQLRELESVVLSQEELEKLRQEQKRLNHIEELASNIQDSINLVAENDDSIITTIHKLKSNLETCATYEPEISAIVELIKSAGINMEEARLLLRQHLDTTEFSDEHKQQVEEKLDSIHMLARKHQVLPEDLAQIQLKLKQQLQDIQNAATKLEQIKAASQKAETEYLEVAQELTTKRKSAAIKLSQLITIKMQNLGMIGGKFAINLLPNINKSFSQDGLERVEFLVCANPGQPLQPLTKVASGGELSRISLAIQTITATKEVTPTLIFDEIDTGIGGKTADIVGRLLRQLSEKTQVISITHLPQIAAQSHHHVSIEKNTNKKNTTVTLTTLNKTERIKEIARMLGGAKITKQTLAHAEEMLNAVI